MNSLNTSVLLILLLLPVKVVLIIVAGVRINPCAAASERAPAALALQASSAVESWSARARQTLTDGLSTSKTKEVS